MREIGMHHVLDIGNCGADHTSLRRVIEDNFDARLHQADTWQDAERQLRQQSFSLVLVNRILDYDGTEGLEVIRQLRQLPETEQVPVMLISNFPEYQERAVAAGARPGFGKAAVSSNATLQALGTILQS